MKRLAWVHTLLLTTFLLLVVTACETGDLPPITVVVPITAVEDQGAVDNAVNATLTSIAEVAFGQTATVVAQGGITYTPSATFTPSITPTPTPTRIITNTPTPRPSETATPTFAPIDTNTPQPVALADTAWIRVLHAYRDLELAVDQGSPVDVYINDQRVQRALTSGAETNYLQVVPGTIRVTLRLVDDFLSIAPEEPLISQTFEVPPGSTTAVIIRNELVGENQVRLGMLPLREDVAGLGTGRSRLTLVHSNPELLPVNAILSDRRQALAYNFLVGQIVGPLDAPAGEMTIDLFDSQFPDQYITSLPTINLSSYRTYIVVLSPYRGAEARLTDSWVFSGNTRISRGEVFARFIHAADTLGPFSVNLNQQTIFTELLPGQISDPVPVSASGNLLSLSNRAGAEVAVSCEGPLLGPWEAATEVDSDKLILITTVTDGAGVVSACVNTLSLNPSRSAINANLRLINMLPNSVPLSLQVRPFRTEQVQDAQGVITVQEIGEDRNPWVTLTDTAVRLGGASDYLARVPATYDIRIVPAGTANTLTSLESVQLNPGGVYDLIVLPGADAGSARLVVVQPQVQVTNLAINEGDPTAIAEAVAATLTSAAPRVTSTPTPATTPTATPTPVLTNTPRPTSTPNVLPPSISVDVVPPDQVIGGVFTINGINFSPERRVVVTLDSSGDQIAEGRVLPNGAFTLEVTLPTDVPPGPQSLRVTVIRPDGQQQVAYALILVAAPGVTPSPTPAS